MADIDTDMDGDGRNESQQQFRKHFLFLLVNMEVDVRFLVYLYSYREGDREVLDRNEMQNFASERCTNCLRQKYDLIMHLYTKGYHGLKALVQALVFTDQKYLADEVHQGISQAFWNRRAQHYPRFK